MISPAQVPSKDIVEAWLYSLGVVCDCDNGIRFTPPGNAYGPNTEPCDRCVLVEVGGVNVRAVKDWLTASANMILPGVEVDDE